uniref:Ig-like domain-containing protein n=1 Tax=Sarcophilus harrisii TaxID=9305 RepID=A0A7N4PSR8_SARHA
MPNRLFCWITIFLFGAAPTETGVTQTPRYLVTRMKQEVTLRCEQNLGHDHMYWYQQKSHKGPKLMFYFSYGKINLNDSVPNRFDPISSGNGHLTLNIHTVEAEDSAIYFCSTNI